MEGIDVQAIVRQAIQESKAVAVVMDRSFLRLHFLSPSRFAPG